MLVRTCYGDIWDLSCFDHICIRGCTHVEAPEGRWGIKARLKEDHTRYQIIGEYRSKEDAKRELETILNAASVYKVGGLPGRYKKGDRSKCTHG